MKIERGCIKTGGFSAACYGVADAVPDPQMFIYAGATKLLAVDRASAAARRPGYTPDRTMFNPALLAGYRVVENETGAFPMTDGANDCAVFDRLPAGPITIQTSSSSGTAGTVLTEVYLLPYRDITPSRLP